MRIIRGINNFPTSLKGCAVSIGKYDGIHLGHQQLLRRLIAQADSLRIPALVITFEPLPQEYFTKESFNRRLNSFREKIIALEQVGIDRVLCLRFDAKLVQLSAAQFIDQILVDALGVKLVMVGHDFEFGADRNGNDELLREYGSRSNFQVESLRAFKIEGITVSSSLIYELVANGDLKQAQKFLGRPYSLFGKVIRGDRRGRELGFRTANLFLRHAVIPVHGVYAVQIRGLGTAKLNGVANIGFRPTVNGIDKTVEIHIFDFNQNIYGRRIDVDFLHKIRNEQKFMSLDALKAQILQDIIEAQLFFGSN